MRIHFQGQYTFDKNKLPQDELQKHENAVPFKEFTNSKSFIIMMNLLSFLLFFITGTILLLKIGITQISITGIILSVTSLLPHEFIHALFFKKDVYIYIYKIAAMVTGTEPMSKLRFILMCAAPSICFGFIPFLIFLINNDYTILGTLGAISIPMGVGDYYNIYNCITQVPKGGKCFMHKENTYWYKEDNEKKNKNTFFGKGTLYDKLFVILMILPIILIYLCGLINKECPGSVIFISLCFLSMCCLFWFFQLYTKNA